MPLGINGACRTPNWQPLPYTGDPAPGYRLYINGALSNVGNSGFSYSSSVNGINGIYLTFHAAGLGPSHSNYRAYGFQLRCLSE